jgi:hypothetical protein
MVKNYGYKKCLQIFFTTNYVVKKVKLVGYDVDFLSELQRVVGRQHDR